MADGALHDFIGGLISGSAGVLVGHPFDTVKSRGFFRGLSWPMLSAGLINSVFFGVYSQILKVLGTSPEKQHDHPDYVKVGIASSIAGFTQLVIACPIEVIKVVLQSQIPHGVHKGAKFYHGPIEGVVNIIRQSGFKGIYRGFTVQLPRDVIASSIYFTTFEYLSFEGTKLKSIPSPVINFFAGGFAGVVSWVAIIPFDVVKSRMQADVENKLYKNMLDCVIKSYRDGGIRIFHCGIGMICLRAFPVNAVTLMVYSEYMKFFDAKFLP